MSFKTKVPPEIYSNFKQKRCCFFVGAGLSIPAGFPTWAGLLDKLVNVLVDRGTISKEKLADYENLKKDSTKFLFLAEDLKSEIGSTFFD